jgi:hypothetical protein
VVVAVVALVVLALALAVQRGRLIEVAVAEEEVLKQ